MFEHNRWICILESTFTHQLRNCGLPAVQFHGASWAGLSGLFCGRSPNTAKSACRPQGRRDRNRHLTRNTPAWRFQIYLDIALQNSIRFDLGRQTQETSPWQFWPVSAPGNKTGPQAGAWGFIYYPPAVDNFQEPKSPRTITSVSLRVQSDIAKFFQIQI